MIQILILGKGTIGTFMGISLRKSEVEVKHLIRNVVGSIDRVICKFNDRRKAAKIKKGTVYRYALLADKNQIAQFTYILVPVAHHQWRQAIHDLKPYIQMHQTLVLMGNIWDDFDWFKQQITCPYIFAFPNFGGAIIDGQLHGWLTSSMTIGWPDREFEVHLHNFNHLLREVGFAPKYKENMRGYLLTHFAWIAGSLVEALKQKGYQSMTNSPSSLRDMYLLVRECMQVVEEQGIDYRKFKEGRKAWQPVWWNVVKTYLIFCLPGLAKKLDTTMDLKEWSSYGTKLHKTARLHGTSTPLLDQYEDILVNYERYN